MNTAVNRGILIPGFVIVALSVINQWFVKNQPQGITKILVGAYVLLLVLALVDLIPGMSAITTGIAVIAMLTTIILYGANTLNLFAGVARATGAATPVIGPGIAGTGGT